MTPSPVHPVFPILLYHSLSSLATPTYRPYAVDPGRFREQMELIAAGGHLTLTVRDLVDILADPAAQVPARAVVITFDDGFDDIHRVALPILERLGLRATTFVVTGYLGRTSRWLAGDGEGDRQLLSWTQLHELAANGIEIGSHSHTHQQLDTIPAKQLDIEITRSRAVLEDGLQAPVTSFAYPHGYHTAGLKARVRAAGYTAGCGVKHALSHSADDPWALGRAVVADETPSDVLATWLEGRGLPLAWSRERPQTTAWRLVRRTRARLRRGASPTDPTGVA